MGSRRCQCRSVPSLVAIGQFPCPREPNKSHFRFYEVTSGSGTSLPVPLWSPLGVSSSLCQVLWQSDNFPAWESQIRVTSCSWRQLPVLWCHFRCSPVVSKRSILVYAKFGLNRTFPSPLGPTESLTEKPEKEGWLRSQPYDVTSGLVMSLPITRSHSRDVPLTSWQVWWQSDERFSREPWTDTHTDTQTVAAYYIERQPSWICSVRLNFCKSCKYTKQHKYVGDSFFYLLVTCANMGLKYRFHEKWCSFEELNTFTAGDFSSKISLLFDLRLFLKVQFDFEAALYKKNQL